MTALDRRTALSLLGSGVGLTVLAGCSETADDSDDGEDPDGPEDPADASDAHQRDVSLDGTLPSYASVLPETDGSGYLYGAIDVSTMASLLDDDAEAGDEPTDPLVGNPIVVALYCSYGLELLASSASLEAFQTHSVGDDPTQETFVFADGVYAFTGSYDVDGFAAALDDIDGYDRETAEDAYAVYSNADGGEVVGVADEVYVLSSPNADADFDPVKAVERTVATAAGDREPKHAVDDGFDRLLRDGAADGITLGLATAEDEFRDETLENAADDDVLTFEFDAFAGAKGIHQHLSVAGDGSDGHGGNGDADGDADGSDNGADGTDGATARAIVTYADEDAVDVDRLTSALGTDADTVESAVVNEGATAVIDAEYAGEFVDD